MLNVLISVSLPGFDTERIPDWFFYLLKDELKTIPDRRVASHHLGTTIVVNCYNPETQAYETHPAIEAIVSRVYQAQRLQLERHLNYREYEIWLEAEDRMRDGEEAF